MDEAMLEKIRGTFNAVLEKQVFMFPDPVEKDAFDVGDHRFLLSWMNFQGEFPGHLVIAVPEALAKEIGANFMGLDVDDDFVGENYQDSLKEILNVTCGHMLTALKGEAPIFDLSMPNVVSMATEVVVALAEDPNCLVFDVEGYPVLLRMDFLHRAEGLPERLA
jgi:hypothetical protein